MNTWSTDRTPEEAEQRAERLTGPHGYPPADQERPAAPVGALVEAVLALSLLVGVPALMAGLLIAHLLGVL